MRSFESHSSKILRREKVVCGNVLGYRTFSEGGNFSREEIETHRKKLEKTAYQIDQAETTIFKEMEKLEKKQLEEATKIMNDFRERLEEKECGRENVDSFI